MAKNTLMGLGELAIGFLLASPVDEAGLAILTGGASLIASPAQIPVSGAIGILLAIDGLGRL